MSYIPASKMPHAKHHEHGDDHHHDDGAAKSNRSGTKPEQGASWMPALAIGGALAIGAVATAFFLNRGDKSVKKSGGRKDSGRGRKQGGKNANQ